MASNIFVTCILLYAVCHRISALPSDDNPHSLSLSKLSTAKSISPPLQLTSTFATESSDKANGSTTSPVLAVLAESEWPRTLMGPTPRSQQVESTPTVVDKLADSDHSAMTTLDTTKRPATAKVRKVVKKMKRAKHWKALDRLDSGDDSAQKWIPMWNPEKELTRKRKSSKRVICVHVAPSRQEQTQLEQFNLVRKCYSVKHIKRADTLDLGTSSSSYSPIIDPNQMLVRSPVMAPPSGAEWIPLRIEADLDEPAKEPTTEPAIDVIPPTNVTEPEDPSTTEKSKTNYLNLYEYQTTNPIIELADSAVVEKPQTDEKAPTSPKETNDRLDQSSSEYFPIVTDIVTLDNAHIPNEEIDAKADAEVQAVANDNAIDRINTTKDLWQVNRRKKQLRDMTMVSRSRELISLPTLDTTDANTSVSTLITSKLRKIPKLLLPKVNRPAMYSLNGYVPKPSLHRVATPSTVTNRKSSTAESNKLAKSAREMQKKRRRKNKQLYDDEETDEIEVSESVSSPRRRQSAGEPNGLPQGNSANKRSKKTKKSAGPLRQWPSLNNIPKTGFECSDKRIDGVYADVETGCQVWHVCQNGAHHSFLCPSGTIFNAKNGVCDWWYNTRCA